MAAATNATVGERPADPEGALRAWFDHDVQPFLAENAAALEQLGRRGLYPVAWVLLAFLAAAGSAIAERFTAAIVCACVLILAVAVAGVRIPLYQAGGAAFRTLFKQQVVAKIVAQVLPGAVYDPDLALARSVVLASGLLDGDVAYDGDDLVRGAVGRTPFALGDVKAGISRRAVTAGFRGLLFHAEFNRSLKGRTLVVPQGQPPQAVPVNRGLAPVTLESPEFEALFSVHASDPVEARYVLTPSTMERLAALARTVGRPLYAAFDRRRVYVAVDNGRGAFEALAFGGEKAWQELRGFAALFDCARAIVHELDLNTRIWTKGFAPEEETKAAAASQPSAWSRVAAQGAWAFQANPSLPFSPDARPIPPPHARIEAAGGALTARFPSFAPAFAAALLLVGVGLLWMDGTWGAAQQAVRDARPAATLVAGSLLAAVIYRLWSRVRWVSAGRGMLRVRRLGPARGWPRDKVRRVFAAEDLVLALMEGSWTPMPLSPRLGSHGAALWLTGEIERAMNGGRS